MILTIICLQLSGDVFVSSWPVMDVRWKVILQLVKEPVLTRYQILPQLLNLHHVGWLISLIDLACCSLLLSLCKSLNLILVDLFITAFAHLLLHNGYLWHALILLLFLLVSAYEWVLLLAIESSLLSFVSWPTVASLFWNFTLSKLRHSAGLLLLSLGHINLGKEIRGIFFVFILDWAHFMLVQYLALVLDSIHLTLGYFRCIWDFDLVRCQLGLKASLGVILVGWLTILDFLKQILNFGFIQMLEIASDVLVSLLLALRSLALKFNWSISQPVEIEARSSTWLL